MTGILRFVGRKDCSDLAGPSNVSEGVGIVAGGPETLAKGENER